MKLIKKLSARCAGWSQSMRLSTGSPSTEGITWWLWVLVLRGPGEGTKNAPFPQLSYRGKAFILGTGGRTQQHVCGRLTSVRAGVRSECSLSHPSTCLTAWTMAASQWGWGSSWPGVYPLDAEWKYLGRRADSLRAEKKSQQQPVIFCQWRRQDSFTQCVFLDSASLK